MEFNFDLNAAIGQGPVILVGINNADGSKWFCEATNLGNCWVDANLDSLNFENSTPKAWAAVIYPF